MNSGDQGPVLLARCVRGLPVTLDQFAERCQAYLTDLIALHSGFAGLHFVKSGDPKKPPVLTADFANLMEGLMAYGWDPKLSGYTELGLDKKPTGNTVGNFRLSLSNWLGFDDKFDVTVAVSPKSYHPTNCVLDFPSLNHPEFLSGPLPMQILDVVLKHWPVRYASFETRGWNNEFNWSRPNEETRGCFELGWHTFVDDASVAEALPPDVTVRKVGNGIVFSLFDSMPDFTNPAHVERGRQVRAALERAGKLKIYPD